MMSIKLDWDTLRKKEKELSESANLLADSDIVFIIILSNRTARKSVVKFKDFLNFFWTLSENDELDIATLVVQDTEGRVLYRHKTITAGEEEIPIGGTNIIAQWSALTQNEKDIYMRLLESQIQGYEK
jgi:hypothetical protein